MLRRMVPVTYLFVVFFLANDHELERTSWLSQLGRVAPDRRLSWREQHGRLGMCFFVSGERVLRSLPWMWASRRLASEARLLLSQVVDIGRIVSLPLAAACSCTCTGLQVRQFWVFCESVPRQILLLGLPVLPGAATGTQVLQFDKKIRSVPHFLQPPAIDKKPESNAKMYVNQRRDEMARTWKHILRHDHFRAKYWYVGVFLERRFQPLSVGGFFSNQRESISRCPKSPFPSKTQNRQIARTSPLRTLLVTHFQVAHQVPWQQRTLISSDCYTGAWCTPLSSPPMHGLVLCQKACWSGEKTRTAAADDGWTSSTFATAEDQIGRSWAWSFHHSSGSTFPTPSAAAVYSGISFFRSLM